MNEPLDFPENGWKREGYRATVASKTEQRTSYPTFARCCPTGVHDVAIQDVEDDVRQAELVSFMSEADAGNEKTNS